MEIDFGLIQTFDLSIEEFVVLTLIKNKKFEEIRSIIKDDKKLRDIVISLISKGFLRLKAFGNIDILGSLEVILYPSYSQDEYDKMFYELISTYPRKVIRPNGAEDDLIGNPERYKLSYRKLIENSAEKHTTIINCLKHQIAKARMTGGFKYFKKLQNWLANEEWKDYEHKLSEINDEPKLGYGQGLV